MIAHRLCPAGAPFCLLYGIARGGRGIGRGCGGTVSPDHIVERFAVARIARLWTANEPTLHRNSPATYHFFLGASVRVKRNSVTPDSLRM